MDGKKVKFPEDYKGKLVMLDFWATWCGPCIGEIPGLVAAYEKYHEKGFEVLGITLDKAGQSDKVKQMLETKKMAWPQTMESDKGPIATLYRVIGWPTYFLIDKDGTIAVAAPDKAKLDLAGELAKLIGS